MSENLRQLGNEASKLYREDGVFSMRLETADRLIENVINVALSDHKILEALGNAIEKPGGAMAKRLVSYGDTPEEHEAALAEVRHDYDVTRYNLGEAVLEQAITEGERRAHNRKAARHYKRNATAYHDLAVIEAQLDGVTIKTSQAERAQ